MSTNFLAYINGQLTDLGNVILNQTSQSIMLSTNDTTNQQYSMTFKGRIAIKTNDIKVAMNGYCLTGSQQYTFGAARQRLYVGCGSVVTPGIGNTLAFSTNGTNWTGIGSTIFNTSANGICYNGKVWIAVGSDTNNSIAFSWDGKSWFGLGPILSIGNCVVWNGFLFVAGGTSGGASATLVYSYDGINWIPALGAGAITTTVTAIGWNGTMWQAGSSVGQMAYSYDGINWTLSTNVSALSGYKVNDIKWTGAIWYVAMNSNSLIVYSADGINWSSYPLNSYFSMTFNQVVWNGVIIMGCGATYVYAGMPLSKWWYKQTTPMTQAKSIKWTGKKYIMFGSGTDTIETLTCPMNNPGFLVTPAVTTVKNTVFTTGTNFDFSIVNPHSVTFPAYMVIAGGSSTALGSATMAYSYDGVTWNNVVGTVFSNSCNTIKYNGRIWVAGGTGGNTLAFSYNGTAWTGLGTAVFSTVCNSVVWSGTIWVAVGNTGIAYSYDGLIWVPVTSAYFNTTLGGKSVAYNGKIFVAVGGGTVAGNSIVYSSNGIQWTPSRQTAFSDIVTQGVNGISWSGSKWVAVGNGGSGGNSIAYSYNGSTWTGLGVATFPTYGNQVAWNGRLFVATGQVTGSGNCAATSYDGITWSGLGKIPFTTGGSGIGWDGTRWQMGNVAASSAAYSYDGRTWTSYSNNFASTTCFGTNYGIVPIPYIQHPTIAVGYGPYQIAYSDDGITWQGVGTGIFYGQANAVAWNGSLWIAVGSSNGIGNNNTIAYSIDGINWIGLGGSIFSGSGNGIAWNGQIWIATGNDSVNTLAYSTNGIQWIGLGNSVFSVQGSGVAYNGTAWVATGQGGNTLAYSTNGIQWTGIGSTVFTQNGTNIATNGTYWIATGSGGAILAYTAVLNGSSGWTPLNTPFAYSGNGIAWNGQIWVATGADSTNMIAYSYDGLNWTAVANSGNLFQYMGKGVCWNGVRFIAGGYGYGQNSIVYSPDGINWYPGYDGQNFNFDPNTGFYTAQIFTQCISVASNSNIGVPVVQSQMILNPTQNIAELIVATAHYYQQGFNEISFKIEQNNMY